MPKLEVANIKDFENNLIYDNKYVHSQHNSDETFAIIFYHCILQIKISIHNECEHLVSPATKALSKNMLGDIGKGLNKNQTIFHGEFCCIKFKMNLKL